MYLLLMAGVTTEAGHGKPLSPLIARDPTACSHLTLENNKPNARNFHHDTQHLTFRCGSPTVQSLQSH